MGNIWSRKLGDVEAEKAVESHEKYTESANSLDLRDAIAHCHKAARARQSSTDIYPNIAVTTANSLWYYYERNGKHRNDLDEVISLFEEALDIWKGQNPRHQGHPTLLINLGNTFRELFSKDQGQEGSAQRSIDYYTEARAFRSSHPEQYTEATLMLGTFFWERSSFRLPL